MKEIKFTAEELKLLITFLATTDSNLSRFAALARENNKEMFSQLVGEKKIISGIMEKLIKK